MIAIYGIELCELREHVGLEAALSVRLSGAWHARHPRVDDRTLPSLAAYLLLQHATERGTLCYRENGKPCFSDSEQTFSITHTDRHAFCAVTVGESGELGIDAEDLSRIDSLPTERLAKRWFTDAERAQLTPTSAECFARLWTRKEALVKLTGEGLSGLSRQDTTDAPSRLGVFFSDYRIGDTLVSLCAKNGLTVPHDVRMLRLCDLLKREPS